MTQKETINLLTARLNVAEETLRLLISEREEELRSKKDEEEREAHHNEWRSSFRREVNRINNEDAQAKKDEEERKAHHNKRRIYRLKRSIYALIQKIKGV